MVEVSFRIKSKMLTNLFMQSIILTMVVVNNVPVYF